VGATTNACGAPAPAPPVATNTCSAIDDTNRCAGTSTNSCAATTSNDCDGPSSHGCKGPAAGPTGPTNTCSAPGVVGPPRVAGNHCSAGGGESTNICSGNGTTNNCSGYNLCDASMSNDCRDNSSNTCTGRNICVYPASNDKVFCNPQNINTGP
jgi:hypothetical protein